MKVYTTLLVFAASSKGVSVVTDNTGTPPIWTVPNSDHETLDLARMGFYNISGIAQCWHPPFVQTGVYEFFRNNNKELYITYSAYMESVCDLQNLSYEWRLITDLEENGLLYNIIRYIYSIRK